MNEKTLNILLVEDNPDYRELILKYFNENSDPGCNIFTASDGEETLDFLSASKSGKSPVPNLIILDTILPKISGMEVLKKIKNNKEFKMLPVIILSTSAQQDDINDAYGHGANSYVCKPVKFEDFVKTMSEIRKYWLSTNIGPATEKGKGGFSNERKNLNR